MTDTTKDRWTDRLSAYIDAELRRGERGALERHLETCASCRRALDELRAIKTRAAALEDRVPSADLWPGIARRLEEERPRARARLTAWLTVPRFAFSLPQLAGAAALLVVLSGGAVWVLLRGPAGPAKPTGGAASSPVAGRAAAARTPERETAGATAAPAGAAGTSDTWLAGYDFARYQATIAELEGVVQEHRAELDTSTVRVIEQNLTLIDHAIADARRALEADPSNPYLNGHLAQQLQRKVRLLQRATDLVAGRQG